MSDRAVELARASRYDAIADAIEGDSEWFADDTIDDGEIVDALRLAAAHLRGEPEAA